MHNNRLLYNPEVSSESESECSDEEECEDTFFNKDIKYDIKKFQVIIDTNNRDWETSYKSVFDFMVRFNASETSVEEIRTTKLTWTSDVFDSNNVREGVNYPDVDIKIKTFKGSNTLSIPITIKNVNSIYLEKIIIPNRKIFLGEGNYINLLDFPFITVTIEEFSNIVYGTSDSLSNSFANMSPLASVYPSNAPQKFIELKNITRNPKVFKPAPLNSINTLTIKIKDNLGNQLKFRDETLSISNIVLADSTGNTDNSISANLVKKFIKITTVEYFSIVNYIEGDIVYFKNIENLESNSIKKFIEREQGHKIFFTEGFISNQLLENLDNLQKVFYILNNCKINTSNGTFDLETGFDSITGSGFDGNIINRNLQLMMYFNIENFEKRFDNFTTQII